MFSTLAFSNESSEEEDAAKFVPKHAKIQIIQQQQHNDNDK